MGPRLKLPRFVHGFIDRHGKPRFYFRRPGFESRTLHGLPYSAEFMSDYEAAITGQPLPVGANRARPGTMWALALSYFSSPHFRILRPSTQLAYRGIIERLCREHGDKRAADLRREHVVRLMAARANQPGSANGLRNALRVMMKHAIDLGLRADDPTREVRPIRVRTTGHHSWTDEEIAQFEQHHAIGTRALLAKAEEGDVRAIQEVGDRIDGRVPQAITGDDHGPPVTVRTIITGVPRSYDEHVVRQSSDSLPAASWPVLSQGITGDDARPTTVRTIITGVPRSKDDVEKSFGNKKDMMGWLDAPGGADD